MYYNCIYDSDGVTHDFCMNSTFVNKSVSAVDKRFSPLSVPNLSSSVARKSTCIKVFFQITNNILVLYNQLN